MAAFTRSDDLRGASFVDTDLTGARFVESDLSGVVMRGVQLEGADLDAPWVTSGGAALLVNGIDVAPYVEAELNRKFPGREQQRAGDPEGLRSAWAVLERTWAATVDRAAAMPDGTVGVSVDGEWSFAQTLRHLVLATDTWLGRGVLGLDDPYHPLGLRDVATEADATDASAPSVPSTPPSSPPSTPPEPSYDEVLEARAGRLAMVRDFLATVTPEQLAEERRNPHDPAYPETVLSCLHVILEEEWEHHRYAVRDLDAIATGG